jgi:NitT/TauT family transport system permease protein
MQRSVISKKLFSVPDLIVLLMLGTLIYGLAMTGNEWRTEFNPITAIDLSPTALPYYTMLSAFRGFVAYGVSLFLTFVFGYIAAKSGKAELFIIPFLDIMQCVPVLGFLPGLVLGLISIFPKTNTGLEIAAIILIVTSQAWNMIFSFYSSIRSVPHEYTEVAGLMNLNWRQKLRRVELPYSAINLAWNSLLSMAGGWFFLTVCEAFVLGESEFRLAGIGSYMAVAIKAGNTQAMWLGIVAMTLLILLVDFLIWRPIMSWVQKFRVEEGSAIMDEPLIRLVFRESRLVRYLRGTKRRPGVVRKILKSFAKVASKIQKRKHVKKILAPVAGFLERGPQPVQFKNMEIAVGIIFSLLLMYGSVRLFQILTHVNVLTWVMLVRNTIWTLLRISLAVVISSLWTIPFGIWIGLSAQRIRIAQPIIQIVASFPAPMLYPLVLSVLFALGINFDIGSTVLMLMGVQWYILFNVLAGALRIPVELSESLALMNVSVWNRWKSLYFPSIFPTLVVGWLTAAGGAWNSCIVAEYIVYNGAVIKTGGLGATIYEAAASKNFELLAAALTVMVFVVIVLNRTLWAWLLDLAQNRYRLDV